MCDINSATQSDSNTVNDFSIKTIDITYENINSQIWKNMYTILSKLSLQEINDSMESVKNHVDDYITKIEKIYKGNRILSWLTVGWYDFQIESIKHILNKNENIICFGCVKTYIKFEECKDIKYVYIIKKDGIPTFMQNKITRCFVICSDCVKKNPHPPPKNWKDAIIASIYISGRAHIDSLSFDMITQKLSEQLANKFSLTIERHNDLQNKIADTENEIKELETILEMHTKTIDARNKLLYEILRNSKSVHESLKEEENALRQKIEEVETNIITLKEELNNKMNSFVDNITQSFLGINDVLKTSELYKVKKSLKLSEPDICKICYDKSVDIVLIPCGHCVACESCINILGNTCPLCRKQITSKHKIYHI